MEETAVLWLSLGPLARGAKRLTSADLSQQGDVPYEPSPNKRALRKL